MDTSIGGETSRKGYRDHEQHGGDQHRFTLHHKKRPLPSSQVLLNMVEAESRPPCPLIQSYLCSIGMEHVLLEQQREAEAAVVGDPQERETRDVPSIDDPRHSTLTSCQHKRYLELQSKETPLQFWKPAMRKEFTRLQDKVKAEQEAYRSGVLEFWQNNCETVLMKLAPNNADSNPSERKEGLLPQTNTAHPTHFSSRCSQIISLSTENVSFDLDAVKSEVLETGPISTHKLPHAGQKIPLATSMDAFPRLSLRNDAKALELAKEHKVGLMTTADTLEILLQNPRNSRWLMLVSKDNDTIPILEATRPQPFRSPRLTLIQEIKNRFHVWGQQESTCGSKNADAAQNRATNSFRYLLLTLPPVRHGHSKLTILVRDDQPSYQDHSADKQFRICIHVDYFPQRGREVPDRYEKAVWLLHHVLFPSQAVMVGRVDPATCQILEWEPISRAHALVVQQDVDQVTALDLWRTLVHFLHAVPTIREGVHLLCHPAKDKTLPPLSVSVHQADSQGQVLLEDEVNAPSPADPVELCFCPWKWTADRVPCTFPTAM